MAERVAETAKTQEKKQRCPSSCKQNSGFSSSGSSVDRILQLQRTAGNQAVQRLIKSGAIQAKLKISQPNDVHEQEADRVAEQVMKMPDPRVKRQPEREVTKEKETIKAKSLNSGITPPAQRLVGNKEKKNEEESLSRAKILASEIIPFVQRQVRKGGEKGEKGEEIFRAKESGKNSQGYDFQNHFTQLKGEGTSLPEPTQKSMESRFGTDLSAVRVHTNSGAAELAREINARAFTSGKDIYFGENQFRPGTGGGDRLLAHEITHVIQQRGNSSRPVSRVQLLSGEQNSVIAKKDADFSAKTETNNASMEAGDMAPGIIELKGMTEFKPPEPVANYFNEKKKGNVKVSFGKLAEGIIKVEKLEENESDSGIYKIENQAIPLKHPLFAGPDPGPNLILNTNKDIIKGYVAVGKPGSSGVLINQLIETPDIIGLAGFDLLSKGSFSNKLENGVLELGLEGIPVNLGGAFSGNLTMKAVDENVTFNGSANINVTGLGSGTLVLSRSDEGLVKGEAKVGVQLTKCVSGEVTVFWTGEVIEGEGKVGYQGEKLSGNVLLKVMERKEAERLATEKKAPSGEESPGKSVAKTRSKNSKLNYAVFGEGDLTFSFTEWLNGTAHTIVDQNGYVTVIGKITPQKEFELFPQKDYNKDLFKIEARTAYGLPVVGNVFIFANVGMGAFAKLGPATFCKIEVDGTYSTNPKTNKDFSIRGSLNISATAGLKLRGEAGVGLEILAHDIKAGAGINGIAGIKGYAEATPIIGYREKGTAGEDKKGEFFIRGELEIAAQPFLGLSGDLFVEVDSPIWSPLPDNKWTWPLFGKEWPIGGNLGIGATVDYVFGSGMLPSLDFKPVEFSADKFMTDLYSDKAKSKSGEKDSQKGQWAEKNSKSAEPPSKAAKKGNAQPGKAAEPPSAKSKVQPGGGKKAKKDVDPNAKTKEGKTVKQLQDEAARKGKKSKGKKPKGKEPKGKGEEKGKEKKEHDKQLKEGLVALDAVTNRYVKDGATKEEVETGVKAVRKKFRVFKSITIVESQGTWNYHYIASKGEAKGPKVKHEEKRVLRAYHGTNGDAILGILRSKKMKPCQGKIFLAKGDFGQAFMHGGDTKRKASFVIEVELIFDSKKVSEQFGSTQGVQNTQLLTTAYPVETKVLKLFIRKPDGEGKFLFEEISGEQEIVNYLMKKQDKDKKEGKEPKREEEEKGKPEDKEKAVKLAKDKVKAELKTQLPKGARQVADVNKVLNGVAPKVKPSLSSLYAEEVRPGEPKNEGAIGFKVKGKDKKKGDVLIDSVGYSQEGTVLSHEERWKKGVEGVTKSVKKLTEREISEETIKAQFSRWESEFGFKTKSMSLNTKNKPWVIEGEMSPGNKVATVASSIPETKIQISGIGSITKHPGEPSEKSELVVVKPLTLKGPKGTKRTTTVAGWNRAVVMNKQVDRWVKIHLLSHLLHGSGSEHKNLALGTKEGNKAMEKVEHETYDTLKDPQKPDVLQYEAQVKKYRSAADADFPESLSVHVWEYDHLKDSKGKLITQNDDIPVPEPTHAITQVNLNSDEMSILVAVGQFSPELAQAVIMARGKKGPFKKIDDLLMALNNVLLSRESKWGYEKALELAGEIEAKYNPSVHIFQ